MKEKNIYVVGSPLQLLGAIEAASCFPADDHLFVIFLSRSKLNNDYVQQIVDYFSLKNLIWVKYKNNSLGFLWKKCQIISKLKYDSFERLFLGDFGEFSMLVFGANINCKFLFLLDDGTATLSLSKAIKVEKFHIECFDKLNSVKDRLKKGILKYFRLKHDKYSVINWFTIFDFEPLNRGIYFKHNFSFVSNYFNENSNERYFETTLGHIGSLDNSLIFIGSSGVDIGVITDEQYYVNTVKSVIELYPDYEFIYIPHRFESVERLQPLVDSKLIKILRLNNIIEIEFLSSSIQPSLIVSFYSTALYTLKILKPKVEIVFLDLDIQKIHERYRKRVLRLQSYYLSTFKKIRTR